MNFIFKFNHASVNFDRAFVANSISAEKQETYLFFLTIGRFCTYCIQEIKAIYGLETLKIKETDRLEALRVELSKLGAMVVIRDSVLLLGPSTQIKEYSVIKTYQDHRMAMAFAPACLLFPITIEHPEVVSKSYPNFWKDLNLICGV